MDKLNFVSCALKTETKASSLCQCGCRAILRKSDPGREEMYCRRVQIRFKDFGLIGFWMEC